MILCVNLNAAVDRTLVVDGFEVGQVRRVREVRSVPGGKGSNVAKIVARLGRPVTATGFVGGAAGRSIELGLAERGVRPAFIEVDGESRICYNILDPAGRTQTELLEPGVPVSAQQWDAFRIRFRQLTGARSRQLAGGTRVVTLSGSLPRGLEPSAYGDLINVARQAGARVILDSSGEPLHQGLLAGPNVVKPNQDELEALLGVPVKTPEACVQAARELQNYGVELVVISVGEQGSVVVSGDRAWKAVPPAVEAVNTVGCGDALVAGIAIGLAEDMSVEDTMRLATAAAAAKAESLVPGECDPAEVKRLVSLVQIQPLI